MFAKLCVAALAIMAVAIVNAQSADPCGPAGYYHLSCYQNVQQNDVTAAKQQCFNAWTKPAGCSVTVYQANGNLVANCPEGIAYYFPTDACRSSYQGQEKTNPACSQYNAVGLGNAANRAASHPDYQCPAAGGRKLLEV